ncbi:MAG: hypothetical protein GW911_19560 [Armatimonadetes bacterium]|nr:hypothetical protein [Armatimonadota bacterium]NCO93580.1 hypothetical protein [Armatimonadota bacterium]NCP31263.1 hypothetical protein [Armatimonadota bacterium]NCQ26656.1 hypothetical protein [Armatimonadota bacterium]NDK14233.1 hypothetical protein [Armatimonadota bacterium]
MSDRARKIALIALLLFLMLALYLGQNWIGMRPAPRRQRGEAPVSRRLGTVETRQAAVVPGECRATTS